MVWIFAISVRGKFPGRSWVENVCHPELRKYNSAKSRRQLLSQELVCSWESLRDTSRPPEDHTPPSAMSPPLSLCVSRGRLALVALRRPAGLRWPTAKSAVRRQRPRLLIPCFIMSWARVPRCRSVSERPHSHFQECPSPSRNSAARSPISSRKSIRSGRPSDGHCTRSAEFVFYSFTPLFGFLFNSRRVIAQSGEALAAESIIFG